MTKCVCETCMNLKEQQVIMSKVESQLQAQIGAEIEAYDQFKKSVKLVLSLGFKVEQLINYIELSQKVNK